MKRRFFTAVAASLIAGNVLLTMTGCNKQETRSETAILSMPDGTIVRGTVEWWNYVYKTQLKVKIDGVTYLVGTDNVVIVEEDCK